MPKLYRVCRNISHLKKQEHTQQTDYVKKASHCLTGPTSSMNQIDDVRKAGALRCTVFFTAYEKNTDEGLAVPSCLCNK